MSPTDYWDRLDTLIGTVDLVIDRPKGSAHPRYPETIYPLDYGYLQGTRSSDDREIDVWRGSQADGALVGIVCTVDEIKRDAEVKLLVGCTDDEVEIVKGFHDNTGSMSAIVVRRDDTRHENPGGSGS